MADEKSRALIPLPSGGLANIGSSPKSILAGMVSDALALVRAREKPLAGKRFCIGEYEFRDPDYRQILIWAKALEVEPEDFISRLEEDFEYCFKSYMCFHSGGVKRFGYLYRLDSLLIPRGFGPEVGLEVEEGSIVSLAWDFGSFPISSFEWVDGLSIKRLWFWDSPSTTISLCLSSLNFLNCSDCRLTELDLSKVSALTELLCSGNQLVELDLSAVPALTRCWCAHNQLVELDLSNVLELTQIDCSNNQLVQLDISNQALINLNCSGNRLIQLNLSNSALTDVNCSGNQLIELDLSKIPELTKLECGNNQLIKLDLSAVPALLYLFCTNNQLVELDIRGLGESLYLDCDSFVRIKKLSTQSVWKRAGIGGKSWRRMEI